MVQGLAAGLALCLVIYSLGQAVAFADRMFAYYAASVMCRSLFSFAYFGLAPQYLWPRSQWLTQNTPPLIILLAITASCLFLDRALLMRQFSPRMSSVLRGFLAANTWTLHAFQIGSLFEAVMWMLALSVRMKSMRSHAEQTGRERDTLHGLAHTDALTGLLNRRGLQHALEPALANPCAVYVLDLDGFKMVNDSLGHDAGDALLVAVARRLKSQLRATDLVARWGGDEFVVVACALHGDTEAEAQRVGDKLLATLGESFDLGSARHTIGVTIGYVLAPKDGQDAASLLKQADAAMYAGKQAGKQRIVRGAGGVAAVAQAVPA